MTTQGRERGALLHQHEETNTSSLLAVWLVLAVD
jgi:hypothetical protein